LHANDPDRNRAVIFGEQTWDELHVAYFCFALVDHDLTRGLQS
jgi:hypothetical protein